MRVMYLIKSDHPAKPSPEFMDRMHKMAEQEIKAGRMVDNGGLLPLSAGAHVRLIDGKLSLIDGPFVEAKEVIGGYAVFELRDKDEAIAMATDFMQLHKDHMPGWEGICEIRVLATPPQNNPAHCPQDP